MPHLAGRPKKAGRVTPGLDAIDGGSRLLELSGRPLNRALFVILDGAAVAQRIGQVCHPTDEVAVVLRTLGEQRDQVVDRAPVRECDVGHAGVRRSHENRAALIRRVRTCIERVGQTIDVGIGEPPDVMR